MGQRLYNRYNYVLYGKDGEQLMNYSLKAELDNCYSYADSLDNDGYGARQKTGLKTREMLQFDLLQFLAYLSSSDQAELTLEIKFVREYLNQHFTTDKFRTFKYERTTGDFAVTPPRSLTYFVQGPGKGKSQISIPFQRLRQNVQAHGSGIHRLQQHD